MSRRGARDVEDLPIRSLDEPSSPMGHRRAVSDIGVGSGSSQRSASDINVGSLLRFFKSEFFTPWIRVSYLYKYTNPGIHDYICNSLYSMKADDIEYYLVQLINMLVHANLQSNGLERFLLDQCSKSTHLALQVSWLLQAAVVDSPIHRDRCFRLQEQVEIATVNCARPLPLETLHMLAEVNASVLRNSQASSSSESSTTTTTTTTTDTDTDTTTATLATSEGDEGATPPPATTTSDSQLPTPMPSSTNESFEFALSKMDRCEYFNQVLDFVEELGRISDRLRAVAVPLRQEGLCKEISNINTRLPVGLYLPLWEASRTHFCIVRLAADESVVLKSRERVPYIVYFELIEGNESCASEELHKVASSYNDIMQEVRKQHEERQSTHSPALSDPSSSPMRSPSEPVVSLTTSITSPSSTTDEEAPGTPGVKPEAELSSEERAASPDAAIKTPPRSAIFEEDAVPPTNIPTPTGTPSPLSSSAEQTPLADSKRSPFGEPYANRKERIRSQSPYGHLPTWNLASVIVKYGDDCRQEQLAMQLIQQFKAIFEESGLPLYLRPYRILVTTASSGLIETLFDAVSLHQLKQFYQQENSSLAYHFRQYYGDPESPRYQAAVRNFVESLAGYSLVTYLLQIKDRHNGNIMIDSQGHLIHIDFGFMLSNSPGALGTESAPFKLTQDWMDLMGGTESPFFQHFKTLLTRGFLEIRKHCDKFLMLVEIMAVGSTLPCFYAGAATVDALRDRFHISMTESQIVSYVEDMITRSWDNWRTQIYDHFQYLTNGILA